MSSTTCSVPSVAAWPLALTASVDTPAAAATSTTWSPSAPSGSTETKVAPLPDTRACATATFISAPPTACRTVEVPAARGSSFCV